MRLKTLAALGAAALISLGGAVAQASETIRFAVTDLAGLEQLQREFEDFKEVLEARSGMTLEFYPVNSRTAAVEAMGAERVDFVLTGPAEYVVFNRRLEAVPVVAFQRPDYFAQVVVLADSHYNTAEDLRGSKIAFGDVGSTSAHLGPMQALADQGLRPGVDYEALNISRNVAVEAMIRGDVAGVGMNFVHLRRIREAFPETKFRVVARGRDLPDDILLAGPHVASETVETLRRLFAEHEAELLQAMLSGEDNQKFAGGGFRPGVTDADYNYVRSMYATIGFPEYAEFVGD